MSTGIERDVKRGASVNAIGFLGKAAGPAFLVLIARLYGTDSLGVYLTAIALVETALAFLVAGFKDGALIFVARHSDDEQEHPLLYQALANALLWSFALAGLVILLTFSIGTTLIPSLYASYGDLLLTLLQWMVLVLPLMAFERVVLGATQGLKIMKYEALVGGAIRPIMLLVLASLFWVWVPSVEGLAAAYVTTQISVALTAVVIYKRELSWRPLWDAIRHFRLSREMMTFAFPQNINVAFDRFITNIDVLMLGMFGLSASMIGFYGAGALIVREVRQVKLVFSSAFAPHIVRLFKANDLDQLARSFATTSRWIATPLIPILIGVAILKSDLLHIVHPDFANESAAFMFYLLVLPYLSGSFGLAGNVVVMTGHSKLNLFNSTAAGISNVLLNLLFIPWLGLTGAAIASATTAIFKSGLQLAEMTILLRVKVLVSHLYKPHLAGLVASVMIALSLLFFQVSQTSLTDRIGLTVFGLAMFAVTLYALVKLAPSTSKLASG